MGIQITPIFTINRENFEVDNMTVNNDASIGGDLEILGNLTGNINGDVAAFNTLSINGGKGILQVVECKASETVYFEFGINSSNGLGIAREIFLPFIPSTYYSGKMKIKKSLNAGTPTSNAAQIRFYNINGSKTTKSATTNWTEIDVPDGTIAADIYLYGEGGSWYSMYLSVGYTNDYLPLPTPPEIL